MRHFVCKLLCRFFFRIGHLLFIVLTALLQDVLNLRDRNYREEFREQEVAGEEQSEGSEIESNFPNGSLRTVDN